MLSSVNKYKSISFSFLKKQKSVVFRFVNKYKSYIFVALVILAVIIIYKASKEQFDALIKTFILPGSFIGWVKYFSTIAAMDFVFFNPFSPDILVAWFVEQFVPKVTFDFYILNPADPFNLSNLGYWFGGQLAMQLTPRMITDLLLTAGIGAFGSTAGAIAGYGMGRLSVVKNNNKLLQWLLRCVGRGDMEKARKRIKKFGVPAIGVAALPFLPFGIFCWAAGMVKVRPVPFILICLIVRFIRFLILGPMWAWGLL